MPPQLPGFSADCGDNAAFTGTLRDSAGNPYTGYAGTETIVATFWPGDQAAPIAGIVTATWNDHTQGTVNIAIAGTGTLNVTPGVYLIKLEINGSCVYKANFELLAAPGSGPSRTTKIAVSHMRKHFDGLPKILAKSSDPTALEARADAWDWIVDLAHRHYRYGGGLSWDYHFTPWLQWQPGDPNQLASIYRPGARSTQLQTWLDAGALSITTPLIDAMAFHAIAQVARGQVGAGDQDKGWAAFALKFEAMANDAVTQITLELDTDGDGNTDTFIKLGVADTLEG